MHANDRTLGFTAVARHGCTWCQTQSTQVQDF